MAKNAGRPPKPERFKKTQRVQIMLTPAEHKRLSRYAQQRDSTISDLLRAQIRSLLNEGRD